MQDLEGMIKICFSNKIYLSLGKKSKPFMCSLEWDWASRINFVSSVFYKTTGV